MTVNISSPSGFSLLILRKKNLPKTEKSGLRHSSLSFQVRKEGPSVLHLNVTTGSAGTCLTGRPTG